MQLAMDAPYPSYGLTKAEIRKSNKPIMEKRRRARINNCLNELKSLILDAMKKDPARHSKLEKADILEMTVKHLQNVQREQMSSAVAADPSVLAKFQTGFSECATEVSRYVNRLDGVEQGVKQRLLAHLSGCLSGLNQILPLANSALATANNNNISNHNNNEDVNNNPRLQDLQFVQRRLSTGELALLLPNPGNPLLPEHVEPGHRSAFTAVSRARNASPGPLSPDSYLSSSESEHEKVPLHTQLRVITPEPLRGDALDFSVKREDSLKRPADTLLIPCPVKQARLSPTVPEVFPPSSLHHPERPSVVVENKEAARGEEEPSTSSGNGDMWRPW